LRLSREAERGDIREQSILKTEILSHIARDLQIPVIFTSFMPRTAYAREGEEGKMKTPTIGYLKRVGI